MIINRNKTVMGNLIDLIKESNPDLPDMQDNQVVYGAPVPDNTHPGRNSRIVVQAINNLGFKGSRTLWYSRCTLTEGLVNTNPEIIRQEGETNAQVASRAMAALNIHPTQVDLSYPDHYKVQFTAKNNSGIYLPGNHTLNLSATTMNLGPARANLVYPFRSIPSMSTYDLKMIIGNYFGIQTIDFKLGENADDVFTTPIHGGSDVNVKMTLVRPNTTFNGSLTSYIPLRFPYFIITDIPTYVQTSGWYYESNIGWVNNSFPWNTLHPLAGLPAHTYTHLNKMSGLFTCYHDTPAGGMGENSLLATTSGGGNLLIGIDDGNTLAVSGMGWYQEGVFNVAAVDLIDFQSNYTFPSPLTFTQFSMRSNYYQTYPRALRGVKWIRFDYFVTG